MGHLGRIQMGPMGCYRPMGLTRWAPWALGATTLPPKPHAIAALVIIGPMRPIPRDPCCPSGSSERARGHHGHHGPHLKVPQWAKWVPCGARGAHGAHPMGPMGPMGRPRILEHNAINPTGARFPQFARNNLFQTIHFTTPPSPRNFALVIIGPLRPIPWDPFDPSGSSE